MARGKLLGNGVRKAYASKGDDTTLSRFVKVSSEHKAKPKTDKNVAFLEH